MSRTVTSHTAASLVLDAFASTLERSHDVPRCAVPDDRVVPVPAGACQRTERGPVRLDRAGPDTAQFTTTGHLAGLEQGGPVNVTIRATAGEVTTAIAPVNAAPGATRTLRVHGHQHGPLLRYFDESGRELVPSRAGDLSPEALSAVRLIQVNVSLRTAGTSAPVTVQRWVSAGELQ